MRYLQDLYDAEIAFLDEQVGDFLERLDERGHLENTLIVVTSDHGEEFADHGQFGHGWSLYQEQLRVPLILYGTGTFEGGLVASHPVHAVDIAPTVATIAGATLPASWSGDVLTVEAPANERPVFTPYFQRQDGRSSVSLQVGSLKFVHFETSWRPSDPHPGHLLFDLDRDPGEQVNLWDPETGESWLRAAADLWEQFPAAGESARSQPSAELLGELHELGYVDQ